MSHGLGVRVIKRFSLWRVVDVVERVMVGCLRADVLKAVAFETHGLVSDVVVHQSIDSTNNWSIQQCKEGKALPFICFAENQTAGKGRRGKQWLMSAGSNIAMSISWPYDLSRQRLHLLPLSIALAVARTLEELKLQQVQIKWPNDIYVGNKKIAGILIETVPIKSGALSDVAKSNESVEGSQTAVVIGIGLNYDVSALALQVASRPPADLPDMTDIVRELSRQEVGKQSGGGINREFVASLLLQNVIGICQNFQRDAKNNLAEFRAHYDLCKNRAVEVLLDSQQTLSGVAMGVNDAAELLVVVDGEERVFNSAEVSVKAGL